MSVFRGNILEYPGVIVDHFTSTNCQRGRAFFLSHCHKDHMVGLDSDDLLQTLKERKITLYCSEVTQFLLSNNPEFSHLAPHLQSLPVEESIIIKLESVREEDTSISVSVTLLPAGHCPGSVMFLFQGEQGNVLYTGDFRLTVDEVKKCHSLHTSRGNVLELSTIYLDTTFCHPKSKTIISREETRDIIIKKVEEWLVQSPQNAVCFNCHTFGYEHIFMSLASHFKCKLHIAKWRMMAYSILPSLSQCLTLDGNETRLHICRYNKKMKRKAGGLPCGSLEVKGCVPNVLHIKPSAQWFLIQNKSQPYFFIPEHNYFRVMHSMHASYSELASFITYLHPKSIVPCVIPSTLGDTSLMDLHSRLKELLQLSSSGEVISPIISELPQDTSPLRKCKRKLKLTCDLDGESSVYDTDDDIISSPSLPPQQTTTNIQVLSSADSFDLNLPALQANAGTFSPLDAQPIINLSFEVASDVGDSPRSPAKKRQKIEDDDEVHNGSINDIIDLTQTSDDTSIQSDDRTSPYSVITISDTSTPMERVSITGSSSTSSKSPVLPHPRSTSSSLSPPAEHSLSILPPTPGQERSDNILSKRKLTFM